MMTYEMRTREELINELEVMHQRVGELEKLLEQKKWADEFAKALITTSPLGVYVVQDGKFRLVSPGFSRISGYSDDELSKMDVLDIVLPEDREDTRQRAIDMLKMKRSYPYEFRIRTKDGDIRWVMETVTSVRFGGREAALANFMDITRQKEAEKINASIHKISEAAISGYSTEKLFTFIHQIVSELIPAQNFKIALYDTKNDKIDFAYVADPYSDGPMLDRTDLALSEHVIKTGKYLLATPEELKDLEREGKVEIPGGKYPIWLGVPLKTGDRVMGVVAVHSDPEDIRYGERERDILALVSDQIALAIDRTKKEEELRNTKELLDKVLSSSPIGISVAEDRVIKWVNQAHANLFGYEDPRMLINRDTREFYASEEEYERVWDLYEELKKGESAGLDIKFRRNDGSTFYGHLHMAAFDPSSPVERVVGCVYDITWRKEAEEKLESERERLAVTLQSIGDGVICTDTDGNIVLMNKVAEKLTGWREKEAIGMPLQEVFHIVNEKTRERCENPVEKVLRTGEIVGLANHTVLISKDGTERILADSGAPIFNREGKTIGVVLVFRDITEKRKLEEGLQKAEKLESVGVLAGGIAHDFNNILTAILGNITLAKMYAGSNEKLLEKLGLAEKASQRAMDLTQQLLTFSKGGTPIKKTVSITDFIKDSVNFILRGSNVKAEFFLQDDLWPVDVDEGQINQVINNLVINARQAMPGGGKIRIKAENISLEKGDDILKEGRYVKITVEDEGMGISKKHISRIFDPYFTTKQEGSGLGLATVYSIIKNHDGFIDVESTLGKGTSFHIYLPASKKELVKKEARGDTIPTGKGKVLLMDDEEIVIDVAKEMLKTLGYEVTQARDGKEAIEIYSMAKESDDPFDVVIMDLTVPGGMGGKDAMEILQKIDPGVRAIVSSGYSNDRVMSDFRRYGFKGVVTKPYKINELAEVLHRVIKEDR